MENFLINFVLLEAVGLILLTIIVSLKKRKPKQPPKEKGNYCTKKCLCRTCKNTKLCGMPYTSCQLYAKEEN